MGIYLQTLIFIIIGIILLWFGYTLFFGPISPFYPGLFPWWNWKKREKLRGEPGDPQVCPVCSLKMDRGELVKSIAFPSLSGGRDRLMYIKGCFNCLELGAPRRCPVCSSSLSLDDFLVSRMFERVGQKNHVHVSGCNLCKNVGNLIR
jgi:RNA polymerase subunit RPABC4/transcription elongation factor Spt4